ncbi:MAG: type I DNA topoisomerase [Candidatus Nealsonbacteria bacterium]|nr:MAG: type I DNA topoisomerase [Candidatus Nealsonbacteria bacterium]
MNLVIVESPTKANTIGRYLGKDYLVESSYGHIRDLPEKEFGVDIANDFKPKYVIPYKAKKRVQELKTYLPKVNKVILSTDPDREGEAIAWHLTQVLNLNGKKPYQRIVFHEITKGAIEEALRNPRKIDMNLVNAQQARRILDRIVGYKLSPFLWKKVARGLSAGRVQSVAVRLIVEREKEIENFKPEEYWTIEALLKKCQMSNVKCQNHILDVKFEFKASLTKRDNKVIPKLGIKSKEEAETIVKDLKNAEYRVINIEKKEIKRNPLPPFTTSTLQQEAWQKLRFSAKKTMDIAQTLYERGLITYHRTDSLNLSKLSQNVAKKFIQENYGKDYWPGFPRTFKTKSKVAQEAHEAIRPTYPDRIPEDLKLKAKLNDQQYRLYDLIWRRFIASQMSQGRFDSIRVEIEAKAKSHPAESRTKLKTYSFQANGSVLKFDGFLKVYPIRYEEIELPPLEVNETLDLKKIIPSQHFTQPPPRYSEGTLIKTLEKEGIGRPSTYAPILETIQKRNYVKKDENKKFRPTPIGILVNDLLVNHFPEIVDIGFTARMEENLDKIASGKKNWIETLNEFYQPFEENLEKKYKEISKEDLVEKTDQICPKCHSPLVIRWSRYGKFYACSNFPKCKYTKPLFESSLKIKCPKCKKGEIVERRTKKGKIFYSCSNWPDCDFALWQKPTGEFCPKCNFLLIEDKKGKVKCSNPECNFVKNDNSHQKN